MTTWSPTTEMIFHLEIYVAEFTPLYKDLLIGKPKSHYIFHYANTIRTLHTLRRFTTMRFERMHHISKQAVALCYSQRNPLMTMARRTQYSALYRDDEDKLKTSGLISQALMC